MLSEDIALQNYELKKQALITQIKQMHSEHQPIGLYKNTSNLFRNRSQLSKGMDVRQFNQVLAIDPVNLFVDVEGMTTYDSLVNECLKFQCLPTVVPQLKTITVGGALTGCGIESSSFKFGLMHETVTAFEVLLADGRVVLCTAENEHKDLFFGFPNSYGTLGYALRIRIKLYPVKPFVKLVHEKHTDSEQYFNVLNDRCLKNRATGAVAFLDGVAFAKNELYITSAEFVDQAPYASDYTYMSIYYQSVKQRKEDYLTTLDYIWRWDTDWFWCSKVFYAQNPFIRFFFGKKRLNSASYSRIRKYFSHNKLAQTIYNMFYKKTESVIQDVQIPIKNTVEFLDFFEKNIDIHPIWLCPTMSYNHSRRFDLYFMTPDVLYVNFGFWDFKRYHQEDGYYNRMIEKEVVRLSGVKSLYSSSYYTEDEFWAIYNKDVWQLLKNRYDPDKSLRTLFEKCNEK